MSIMKSEMGQLKALVGQMGGQLECYSQKDDVLWHVGLAGGVHDLAMYRQYMPEGSYLITDGDITVQKGASRVMGGNTYGPLTHLSAANPDFKRRSAAQVRFEQMERQLERLVRAEEVREKSQKRAQKRAQRSQEVITDETENDVQVSEDTQETVETPTGEAAAE